MRNNERLEDEEPLIGGDGQPEEQAVPHKNHLLNVE